MFDVTELFTVFIVVELSVCMSLRVCVCVCVRVCDFNVYYLHVVYALTFVLKFMQVLHFLASKHDVLNWNDAWFAFYYIIVLHAVCLDLFS